MLGNPGLLPIIPIFHHSRAGVAAHLVVFNNPLKKRDEVRRSEISLNKESRVHGKILAGGPPFVFGTWLPPRYGAADPIVLEVMGELAGDYLSGPGKNVRAVFRPGASRPRA
jgi:hypothetical protein